MHAKKIAETEVHRVDLEFVTGIPGIPVQSCWGWGKILSWLYVFCLTIFPYNCHHTFLLILAC